MRSRFDLVDLAVPAVILVAVIIIGMSIVEWWDASHYDGPAIGEVVEKQYDDPDVWFACHSTGVVGQPGYNSCGYQTREEDGPHWWLVLDDGEHRDEFSVSEREFEGVRVGEWFDTKARERVIR